MKAINTIDCFICGKTRAEYKTMICQGCYLKGERIPKDKLPQNETARCGTCNKKNIIVGFLWTRKVCSSCWTKRNKLRLKFTKGLWGNR